MLSLVLLLPLLGATCEPRVPIVDIGAFFAIADASWFEEEQTLFIFYRVDASQGISEDSRVELSFRTDDVDQDFAEIDSFEPVHIHERADCGPRTLCGSMSLRVALPPRDVQLRLRYHKDGALTLDAEEAVHVIGAGPAHTNRSAIVYGVFDAQNERVQWRLRHQFPALRNEEAEALGLRRTLEIGGAGFGTLSDEPLPGGVPDVGGNPYGYGFSSSCPASFTALGTDVLVTTDRALFAPDPLPLAASSSPQVCAIARVVDAADDDGDGDDGGFSTAALARKNPETAPAFPVLRSPVAVTATIPYFFQTCDEIVSERHRQFQLRRLLLDEDDVICIDDFGDPGFVDGLARRFQDDIDAARVDGDDIVLVIGLNRPDPDVGADVDAAVAIEQALDAVLFEESGKSSPRAVGAFVFDSAAYAARLPTAARTVLWCPASTSGDDLDVIDSASLRSCAVQAGAGDLLVLGPVKLASIPVLPTRRQLETFVDNYGEAQVGDIETLEFRAPRRTPLSEDIPIGDFGLATFFNNEIISADVDDAFSFCADDLGLAVVFRVPALPGEVLPLELLPEVQATAPQGTYGLGLAWDFPFHLGLTYEAILAGSLAAVGLTVPFGRGSPAEADLGSAQWLTDETDLSAVLLQCSRFCQHPTFDSAGVYNVNDLFSEFYRNQCYSPRFPRPGDDGSPLDP